MAESPNRLLTPAEAADRLGVSTKTLTRWATDGLIDAVPLPSGHRRYRTEDIDAITNGAITNDPTPTAAVS